MKFSQSQNELQMEVRNFSEHGAWHLIRSDWYHALLNYPGYVSIFLILIPWTLQILLFAGFYMAVDHSYKGIDCGLVLPEDQENYGTYFAFSLETCTTVGYGLPGSTNAFFENCGALQFVIYAQMVFSMVYNAFFMAFIFASISRTEARGSQVIFSKTAILKREMREDGTHKWLFQVRVSDVDSARPVVEAHVRLYAKQTSELFHMRVVEPNDDLGGVLFLSWPNTITHEIDVHSPLAPPTHKEPYRLSNQGLNLRNVDSQTANIEQYCCPVCSETYGDMKRLYNHVRYNQIIETADEDVPVEGTHQELNLEDFNSSKVPELTQEELKLFFPDEIICVVEGIDRIASGTFQALQSYTLDDIEWGGEFCDCLFFSKNKTVMDLSQFHTVVPIPEEDHEESARSREGFDKSGEEEPETPDAKDSDKEEKSARSREGEDENGDEEPETPDAKKSGDIAS